MIESENLSSNELKARELLEALAERVKELDDQIKSLPADKPIAYELNPPGMGGNRPLGTKNLSKQSLADERNQLLETTTIEIKSLLKDSNENIRETMIEEIYKIKNPLKSRTEVKDLFDSQRIAKDLISKFQQQNNNKQTDKVAESNLVQVNISKTEMGLKFTQSLEYSKIPTIKNVESFERKGHDKSQSKDDPDKE